MKVIKKNYKKIPSHWYFNRFYKNLYNLLKFEIKKSIKYSKILIQRIR